jgi:hypothetical protein
MITNYSRYIDKTFNNWYIESFSHRTKHGDLYFNCVCKCGNERKMIGSTIVTGKTKWCNECRKKNVVNITKRGKESPKSKYCGPISGKMLGTFTRRSKKKNLEYSVSSKFLVNLYESQGGVCIYSGLPIIFAETTEDHEHGGTNASLDRIDSDKGYIADNIQWVEKTINKMKLYFNEHLFLTYIKKVIEFNQIFQPTYFLDIIDNRYFTNAKSNAKKDGRCFNIDKEFIQKQWQKQGGVCYYSGCPVSFHKENRGDKRTGSIDRIDSNIGYTNDNCVVCHQDLNYLKRDLKIDEFYKICKLIYDYRKLSNLLI